MTLPAYTSFKFLIMPKDNDKPKPKFLTAQESKILRERLGLNKDSTLNRENSSNFEEFGKQFDITRAKIRKLEEKALQKLRERKGDDDPDAT